MQSPRRSSFAPEQENVCRRCAGTRACASAKGGRRTAFSRSVATAKSEPRPAAREPPSASIAARLDVEAEVQHVAVLDDVVLAFHAEDAGGAAASLTFVRHEVGE